MQRVSGQTIFSMRKKARRPTPEFGFLAEVFPDNPDARDSNKSTRAGWLELSKRLHGIGNGTKD